MNNKLLQSLLAAWPDNTEVYVHQKSKDLEQPTGRQHSTRVFQINAVVGIGRIEQEVQTIGLVI